MFHPAKGMHFTIPMVAYNGAGRLCALFQRQSTNLVSIGKAGFFPLTARTPTPWSILYEPSLMMLSSRTQDS